MKLKKALACLFVLNLAVLNFFAQTPGCICPSVKIIEPEFLARAGDAIEFSAEVKGLKDPAEYIWTVSAGITSEGQGTPAIKIDTDGLPDGKTITATLSLRGNWCPACDNTTVSASAAIAETPKPALINKFVRGNCEEHLARMDSYFAALQNDPAAMGYIGSRGTRRARATAEREVRNWIRIRRFDASRVTIAGGADGANRAEIEHWLVPPGANLPEKEMGAETSEPEPEPVKPTKPYVFTAQYLDGAGGCRKEFDTEGFAQALESNPKSRANVVIHETSRAAFRRREKELLAILTSRGGVRPRIKFFFVKVPANHLREAVELWLLS